MKENKINSEWDGMTPRQCFLTRSSLSYSLRGQGDRSTMAKSTMTTMLMLLNN